MTGIAMHFMMHAYERGDHDKVPRGCSSPTSRSWPTRARISSSARTIRAHISLERPSEHDSRSRACTSARSSAEQARQEGRRKIGILGTNYTMTGPVYPGALGRRGIDGQSRTRTIDKLIHDVIFDELCLGEFKESSRDAYRADHRQAAGTTDAMQSRWFAPKSRC